MYDTKLWKKKKKKTLPAWKTKTQIDFVGCGRQHSAIGMTFFNQPPPTHSSRPADVDLLHFVRNTYY